MTSEESMRIIVAVMEEAWEARNKWIHEGKKSIPDSVRRIENRVDELEGIRCEEREEKQGRPLLEAVEMHGWKVPET